MKIAWLQDLPLNAGIGSGAEANDERMIQYGRCKLNHVIDVIIPTNPMVKRLDKYDLRIVSNCVRFNPLILQGIPKPYVVFHHDFWHCKYRAYYPKTDKCKGCVYAPRWKELYLGSVLNIFLSPLHLKVNAFVIPELNNHPHAFVPSPIDANKFKPNKNVKIKKDTVMGLNCLYEFKGSKKVIGYIKKHKKLKFDLYGADPDIEIDLPKNAEFKGFVDNAILPDIMQQYEYFIHFPQNEAFCRAVVEFLLANHKGKLICTKENIGALSYDIYTKGKIDRNKLHDLVSNAPKQFWSEIDKKLR